jgi:hypothetical protein
MLIAQLVVGPLKSECDLPGAVYGTCRGNALKWFSDNRGPAAGLTAVGPAASPR